MNTSKLTTGSKVCEFVNNNPDHVIQILNELDIDFCCGGFKTLERACTEKGLNPELVLKKLCADTTEQNHLVDWAQLSLSELVEHIVSLHHEYLNKTLPQLNGLMDKVIQAHEKNHPELIELKKLVLALKVDLEPHMLKEERILFPMIKNMDASLESETAMCSSVTGPIRVMMADHENVGMLLEKIKMLTNGYTPPEDACETYKFLFKTLKEIESDTHLHVYKENNLLFPEALNQGTQAI